MKSCSLAYGNSGYYSLAGLQPCGPTGQSFILRHRGCSLGQHLELETKCPWDISVASRLQAGLGFLTTPFDLCFAVCFISVYSSLCQQN